MPPEQTKGKVLPASDLYSLGVTCLHLLTGMPPTELFDVIDQRWMWREYLAPGVRLTSQLREVVDKLVEPSLRHRYRSVEEVLPIVSANVTAVVPSGQTQVHSLLQSPISKQPTTPIPGKPTQGRGGAINLNGGLFAVVPNRRGGAQHDSSGIKIDYTNLRNLLQRKRWEDADEQTWEILCQLAEKRAGTHLSQSEIKKLPCPHLRQLDILWFKYSRGQFGFRIQKRIYEQVGGEYDLFCDRVGWPTYRPTSPRAAASLFEFSLRAPLGHLPSRRWVGGIHWWKHAKVLAEKLEQCGIGG
ncbi:MAG: hypothetical protein F6K24_54520 [Okeania sp. SIO2D1]|nr:hypothetical protein [Okeania sp. SIO2D1]